jgi:hypothetical protein
MAQNKELCPICQGADSFLVFHQDKAPVSQNRLFPTPADARACGLGELDFWRCGACGFVWNRAFDDRLLSYAEDYENNQSLSPAFSAHMDEMGRRVMADGGREELDILEVGCGQGVFLRRLAALAGGRAISLAGFDPTWRGPERQDGVRFYRNYFTAQTSAALERAPTRLVSRHTIEHVPDPLGFLSAMRTAIGAGQARLFIETPCVEWILTNNMFQDFFFEHCSLFTVQSLAAALEKSGFTVDSISHVFGGQYLWAEAHTKPDIRAALSGATTARWRDRLASMKAGLGTGKLALWGAGAKGVTFGLQCDPEGEFLDCVIDINPAKQGHFLPVTAYSILSPADAHARGVRGALVMNEVYFNEIAAAVQAQNLAIALFSFEREHAALTG